jgi:hypothetical protein
MVGNGKVNFDTFFLAANETNFFVKTLMLRGIHHPPNLDHNNEIDTTFSASSEALELAKQHSHTY